MEFQSLQEDYLIALFAILISSLLILKLLFAAYDMMKKKN